ncbi:UDP-2,3-diacylglucosamine diphosphatase [Tautonia plasticadhaerens]|uniref:UDP-2,3-diacylglucosamine hydrolase n=1 Tax=Tautonia plasticadhaerens TaxID=2527974 RepID=A0A518H8U2_9BACT|nr:metallophosphoesterase [Tautonia plasticadhaerens]QDV37259.1 UDP-2,3-diacylglucosamine hydrolase [Tautonia plasticadhaerens]
MADYFASDIHLKLEDRERSGRFASFVESLEPDDALTIVGDLCDFWFASRERGQDPMRCRGLRALAEFRGRGGRLAILTGNHDAWLGPLYCRVLGAEMVEEPLEASSHGVRLSAMHGHRLGARKPWKAAMEGRPFLLGFGAMPGPLARSLADRLILSNHRSLAETHRRHLVTYRDHARKVIESGRANLVLLGHVHDVFDEPVGDGRMIVLGDWIGGTSYVRVDERGVSFVADRPLASTMSVPSA